ncbi:aromatic-ring-hydroxylating dioxygenase subunit beta [Ramlibacter tataouinensis]|uniref:aromatic-ring-hydroxylating dioxygenase subunit beta n=1 Tax=Ramlibacter tataouinensis TaxID=94132 RepID=UPI0022F3A0F4|nr:aromatic-ring-hydroxylating dioxygenase subunit beta [Ramlibacter tataouinensis]WBY03035.1 aromatic-ring-hydroxylating dioxygenase subunit beta [Ramlibacter tataouinensis]
MGAADHLMTTGLAEVVRHHEISQFLFREARLQDEHRYEEWERLWTDDAIYWVPANGEGGDPEQVMSIIYDNRSRIGVRVRQFLTGKRFSQTPTSRLRRVIGNVEVLGEDGDEVRVGANMLVYESHRRGQVTWAARNQYLLRRTPDGWRMARKQVNLVNNDTSLVTLSFLI